MAGLSAQALLNWCTETLWALLRGAVPGSAFPVEWLAPLCAGAGSLRPLLAGIELRSPGTLPLELATACASAAPAVEIDNAIRLASARPAFEELDRCGLRWAALKGVDHLARFYPSIAWRSMADVDVLVGPADVVTARAALERAGFGPVVRETSTAQPAFCLSDGVIFLDLHRRLGRAAAHQFPVAPLLEATTDADIEGLHVPLLHVGPALVTHALLLAKDFFLARTTNPLRAVELAILGRLAADADISMWIDLARRTGAKTALERGLEVARWVEGDAQPTWLAADFGDPRVARDGELSHREFLLHTLRQQDGILAATRYLASELSVSARRLVTGRRAARW